MATMNVSLPDEMKSWAESQAGERQYSNTSDYVRDLIRRDRTRQEKIQAMQAHVTQGLESGIGSRTMDELEQAALKALADRKD